MNIEDQQQKFCRLLDQLAYNAGQLTNMLVSDVVERSPQFYVKTKLHLLSCIGMLSQEVVELRGIWEELLYQLKKAGFKLSEDDSLPKQKKSKALSSKTAAQDVPSESPPTKRGRKKKVPVTETPSSSSGPVEIPTPWEESIHEQVASVITTEIT